MHIPPLIHDLALMLLVAGAMTLIFKKLKQPLVLGYIVTGFLVGPHFNFFPGVVDAVSIDTWSEIGIIILMFSLGLEFNLLKLFSVGKTALITAATELICMFLIGFTAGSALGWNIISSVFLGCMLSMSSTTTIIKAFDDLKLRSEEFTESVFGTLIIEDIAGILMMVVFSTMAVSQGISGGAMTMSLIKMGFYLAIWLILGILLLPTFIKKVENLMSDETLTIVTIGICFGMVLLSHYLGFSSALGAFMAGSLLAGTDLAARIESVTKANKDLFGAIFFISVGMMVDPAKIIANIGTILILTIITVFGKAIFSTAGVFLSGKPLKTSLYSGFSLAQIGEFSFIIASLGISLKLLDPGVYPIIVTVSVITTFTTPFVIKSAPKVYDLLKSILPENLMERLDRKGSGQQKVKKKSELNKFIKTYLSRLAIQIIVLLGIVIGGIHILWPFLQSIMNNDLAAMISVLIVITAAAPFLKQTSVQRNRYFISMWLKNKGNHIYLMLFTLASLVIMFSMVAYPIKTIMGIEGLALNVATFLVVMIITYSDWLIGLYQKIEKLFLTNLGKENVESLDTQLQRFNHPKEKLPVEFKVARFYYDNVSPFWGKSLNEVMDGESELKVIRLDRGGKTISIPNKKRRLVDGDAVYILGPEEKLDTFFSKSDKKADPSFSAKGIYMSFNDFLKYNNDEKRKRDNINYHSFKVADDSPFVGHDLKNTRMKNNHRDIILFVNRNKRIITDPVSNFKFQSGDEIWMLARR